MSLSRVSIGLGLVSLTAVVCLVSLAYGQDPPVQSEMIAPSPAPASSSTHTSHNTSTTTKAPNNGNITKPSPTNYSGTWHTAAEDVTLSGTTEHGSKRVVIIVVAVIVLVIIVALITFALVNCGETSTSSVSGTGKTSK